MNTPRESIYSGIFALLSTAVDGLNFQTLSRRVKLWDKVPPSDQPALFMQQLDEEALTLKTPAPPTAFVLRVDVLIYVFNPSECDSAASALNNAVDKITSLFRPGKTLGLAGVLEARVDGKIQYGEGLLTGQGVAIVPIRILAV